ncbi:SDR family NAD(P)-dependent oxidoreductase [Krasilnikovia sp. MM14-A1004]|uniref:SDR family NAD(P)-dependent oxidoreductase n=1 Tax=Krasilnikovia sp. MM14-A1004 TaxID=3373541 RepID=UPI00399CA61B
MTRLAVVSGGGTGIGRATAGMLAGEGYDVIIVGRRPDVLADAVTWIGPQASAVTADLTDPARLGAVTEAVGDRAVDVLVNNAGGFTPSDDATLPGVAAQWRAAYDVNVMTAVLLTEALLPRMRRPGGRIVLISSQAAQRGGAGPYAAAKAALHGWVFDLAARLGPDGVTANVIAPGYVADTEFFADRMTADGHTSRVAATLVKQPGESGDIAEAVRWLAGPGGGYVTGQIINVNGGSVLGR